MTPGKRLFDIILALVLGSILIIPIIVIAINILIKEGRPVFYVSERMKTPTKAFGLIKFRTMTTVASDSGVSGGNKTARITEYGARLRRSRLDELPQLWNVLRNDVSFVGPRPPLREYVERFPQVYGDVLRSRPGITGYATVYFHAHEEWLLSQAATALETDDIYCRACIPRKARLDLIYQRNQSVCLDVVLILETIRRAFFRKRRR